MAYRYLRIFLLKVFFLLLIIPGLKAQGTDEIEEISIYLTVQQVGGTEMPAVLRGNDVYLPAADLFTFLKIRAELSAHADSITGFFLSPENAFLFDYPGRKIVLNNKTYDLGKDEMILTESNLYIALKYFDLLFGLTGKFSFRALTVNIVPAVELPVVRELRLEMMRKNISKLKGEIVADTVIRRSYPVFSFGMADYSIISTQQVNGPCDNRFNLTLGGILFGGETEIGLNYSTREPFVEEEQYYLWRYANNDFKVVRQIMAGKINSQATSSIYSPVVGFQLTNTPTTYRRSFGSYTLSDHTQPGWIVELYVNNVLVDYVRADASGFFTFQVPMVYGSSNVKLKFYGPWGEERTREQNLTVPYNFLPRGDLEYTVTGGFVEDSAMSRFSRGNVHYGLTSWMTVGGGVEYLSSVTSGPVMPFMDLSLRLGSSFLFSGEYTHGVRFKGVANYRLPSNVSFDAMYIRYDKNQKAINYNILEERKFIVSAPFTTKKISTYARLTLDQVILPATSSTTAELLLSGSFYGINTNFTTYLLAAEGTEPYYYSNLALGLRLPYGFIVTPQVQYDYTNTELISGKIEVEKRLFRTAYANVSFERNSRSNINNLQLGLRYDFSELQAAFTYRQTNRFSNFIESVRGSMIHDPETGKTLFTNRTNTGRGGLVVIPFLDINNNGKNDKGEPRISDMNIRINGGYVQDDRKDTLLRILDLEPYTYYFLTADQNSIKNISWRLRTSSYKIFIDPNQLKLVEIPVSVVGEASGYVFLETGSVTRGQARIILRFINVSGREAGYAITESDGYFSFLGLLPGRYKVIADSVQLKKVGMLSKSGSVEFEIRESMEGDVVDDLEIHLVTLSQVSGKSETTERVEQSEPVEQTGHDEQGEQSRAGQSKDTGQSKDAGQFELREQSEKAEKKVNQKPVARENTPATDRISGTVIRAGAFKIKENASKTAEGLNVYFPGMVHVIEEMGMYKVELIISGKTSDPHEVLSKIRRMGYKDAYILRR